MEPLNLREIEENEEISLLKINNSKFFKSCKACPYRYKLDHNKDNSKHCCNTINFILENENIKTENKESNKELKIDFEKFKEITFGLLNELQACKMKFDKFNLIYESKKEDKNKEINQELSKLIDLNKDSNNLCFKLQESFTLEENIYSLMVAENNAVAIIGLTDGTIISISENYKKFIYKEHTDRIWIIKCLEDINYDNSNNKDTYKFASGSSDSLIKIWELNNSKSILTLNPLSSNNNYSSISTKIFCLEKCEIYNKNILISAQDNGSLILWDINNINNSGNKKIYEEFFGISGNYVRALCYDRKNSKSNFLLLGFSEGNLNLYDLNLKKIKFDYFHSKNAFVNEIIQYTEDIFITQSSDLKISFYNLFKEKPFQTVEMDYSIYGIFINADYLFASLSNKKLIIFDLIKRTLSIEINLDTKLFKAALTIKETKKDKYLTNSKKKEYLNKLIGISGPKINFYTLQNNY